MKNVIIKVLMVIIVIVGIFTFAQIFRDQWKANPSVLCFSKDGNGNVVEDTDCQQKVDKASKPYKERIKVEQMVIVGCILSEIVLVLTLKKKAVK